MRILKLEAMGMAVTAACLGLLIVAHGLFNELAYGASPVTGVGGVIIKMLPGLLIIGCLLVSIISMMRWARSVRGLQTAIGGILVGMALLMLLIPLAGAGILVTDGQGYQTSSKVFPLVSIVAPLVPIVWGIGLLIAGVLGVARTVSRV